MRIVADRFLSAGRSLVDLASGDEVFMRRGPAGDQREAHEWNDRCAALFAIRHPHLVPLIDYGLIDASVRFEAFKACGDFRPRRPGRDGATAMRDVVRFLHDHDLRAGDLSWSNLVEVDGRQAFLPGLTTGLSCRQDGASIRDREQQCLEQLLDPSDVADFAPQAGGDVLHVPRLIGPLLELLDAVEPPSSRAVSIRLGSERDTDALLTALAREARVRGYVPVALHLLVRARRVGRLIGPHHFLVIDARQQGDLTTTAGAKAVLDLCGNGGRHVIVRARTEPGLMDPSFDVATVSGVHSTRKVLQAQRGLPGALQQLVREAVPTYSVADVLDSVHPTTAEAFVKLPAADSGVTRTDRTQRLAQRACSLADRGAHVGAERALRELVGALVRRGRHEAGGEATMRLGRLLLERGRVTEAVSAFEQARACFERAERVADMAASTVHIAIAWIEDARLVDAEAALRSAHLIAANMHERGVEDQARLALTRCLWWQARYHEAEAVLAGRSAEALEPSPVASSLTARVALALGNLAAAGHHASRALELARAGNQRLLVAAACTTMALVQVAVGDLDAAREYVRQGITIARAAHAPLHTLRLHVTLLEGYNRLSRRREARALAAKLARYRVPALPTLLRLRVQHALGEAWGDEGRREAARAAARTSGAHALCAAPAAPIELDTARTLVDLLELCHDAGRDEDGLDRLVLEVRERAEAVSVAVIDRSASVIASAGSSRALGRGSARRALETGLFIPPDQIDQGVESATPIRYAGELVGALACRWTEPRVTSSRAAALLMTAAAASAPIVRAVVDARAQVTHTAPTDADLIGGSAAVDELRRTIRRAAAAPFPVLIEGESGSGKELVARATHRESRRRGARFCAVNCAALTEDLLEAELFGHTRGAFTGAISDRAGLFEEADGGTLLLDEIGELSARGQAKLLRVLQEGEIRRVGETFARRVDVRVIAATNRLLGAEAAAGRFRRDLLYRLDVIHIAVPPLRARPEDIPTLARHFWTRALEATGGHATLEDATIASLARYDWPGNVRELQNVLASLAVRTVGRARVGPEWLPEVVAGAEPAPVSRLEEARTIFERRFVRAALARAGNHRSEAAVALGISRQGLVKLLKRLELE